VKGGSYSIASLQGPATYAGRAALDLSRPLLAFAVKCRCSRGNLVPDAHVEAPTGGSVIPGGHHAEDGRLRFSALQLPVAPDASRELDLLVIPCR